MTFDDVTPMSMPPHYLTTRCSIRLKGDSIDSYLPYFGRAYTSNPATNDRSLLTFTSTMQDFTSTKGKKGYCRQTFTIRNDNARL